MLYLASKSLTRHQLLSSMGIPFTVIDHTASEVLEDPSLKGEAFVAAVARQKMEHAVIPAGEPGEQCFVLTADSLCADRNGKLYAKPADRVEAVAQLKALRSGGSVITAFCLDRHEWQGKWVVAQRIEQATVTTYQLDLPDSWIDTYL